MSAKAKAKELVSRFNFSYDKDNKSYILYQNIEESKRCALILIDELMTFNKQLFWINEGSLAWQYFEDVKREIEKL